MAPPEKTFPLSELENRIHLYDVGFKERSRKLPKDFDLKKDCTLHELVQYSCTTMDEMRERALTGRPLDAAKGMECYPFVRLFRRCKYGNHEFNVETTAWEGRHKWRASKRQLEEEAATTKKQENPSVFAKYGSYLWSAK